MGEAWKSINDNCLVKHVASIVIEKLVTVSAARGSQSGFIRKQPRVHTCVRVCINLCGEGICCKKLGGEARKF